MMRVLQCLRVEFPDLSLPQWSTFLHEATLLGTVVVYFLVAVDALFFFFFFLLVATLATHFVSLSLL